MSESASILDYAPPVSHAGRAKRSIIWTILAIPTCIIPFVDFACSTSPVDALLEAKEKLGTSSYWDGEARLLIAMALNLCVGLIAFLWRIRARLPWRITRGERFSAVAIAGVCLGGFVVTLVPFLREMKDARGLIALGAFVAGLALSIMAALRILKRRDLDALVLTCLLAAFVSVGAYALVGFAGDDARVGWYLTLFSVPVSLLEVAALAAWLPKRKPPARAPAVETQKLPNQFTPANPAPP